MKKVKVILASLLLAGAVKAQSNLQLGLQACYPLDCNVNNFAITGSALDGTPVNVTCVSGHIAGSNGYQFTGATNSYIELPNNGLIKPGAISWSGWVKFNTVGTSQFLVFTKNVCTSYFEGYALLGVQVGSNYVLELEKSDNSCSSGGQQLLFGTTNLVDSTWYHVGFYAGPDSLKIYLNGVLEAAVPNAVSFSYSSSHNVYLGGTNVSYYNFPFGGVMDNVRFYDRKLTDGEFWDLYNLDPSCRYATLGLLECLVACYPLNCDLVNYAPSAAFPPSLDGVGSNVSCTSGNTGAPNTAYHFNGSASSYIQLPNDNRLKPTAISFSGWSQITNLQPNQFIVFTTNGCGSNFEGYALEAADAGGGNVVYSVLKSTSGCSQLLLTTVNSYAAANWNHVVFFMDDNNIKIYVNGVLDVSTTGGSALAYSGSDNVYLGGTNSGIFNDPFEGNMDNVRFYCRELTAKEVDILYKRDPDCDKSWCKDPTDPYCRSYNPRPAAVGIDKNSLPGEVVRLYPNPSEGKFSIMNAAGRNIVIYNVAGQVMAYELVAVDENRSEVSLRDKAEGIYLVKVSDKNGTLLQTSKIVVKH